MASVVYGPEIRRGVVELDGRGETVGGVVIMRFGENAEKTIERVKAKLADIEPTLPKGLKIVTTYDRSELIDNAIDNLRHTLIEEIIIVSLVIMVFLWHFPSAIIPIITIPVTVILIFIPIQMSGMTANIMSLGGIAVAIGAMVDAAIVVVEQTHKKLEHWEAEGRSRRLPQRGDLSLKEVGGPSFFALLVIAVSFLPIFTLEAQEGRLFKPLAYTKNFAMAIAAVFGDHARSRDAAAVYPHVQLQYPAPLDWESGKRGSGRQDRQRRPPSHQSSTDEVVSPGRRICTGAQMEGDSGSRPGDGGDGTIFFKLGSEFMPPLDEGTLLYMPSTMPGISVAESSRILQVQDKIIKGFPEVQTVFGKAGRVESSTDPAPYSMMETVIVLKPHDQWPTRPRWYSSWAPNWTKNFLRRFWPDHQSTQELVYGTGGMNDALQIPGIANAWTMPIKARIDMLTTGVRTPLGVKVLGSDLGEIQKIGEEVEMALKDVKGTTSVFAERTTGGYFLDFSLKRDELARYGLTIDAANDVLMSAIGGEPVTTTVEGRERYPVNVRYLRDYRSDLEALKRVLVSTPSGAQIPMGQIADIALKTGPGMIRDENGRLSGYVYVDVSGRDIGSYVTDAKRVVAEKVNVPAGYQLEWSGQYESMERVRERLKIVLPITLLIVFLLLYFNTGSVTKTAIILSAVPFSAIGAVWLLYLLNYNMSIAVWVGLIALLGVDAETAVFMLLYLDLAFHDAIRKGEMRNWDDLREAIVNGAVKRLRPKIMTVACMLFGLLPLMWSSGSGADVMKRIAAPMVGGIITSFLMELVVYPPVYAIWKWNWEVKPALKKNPSGLELAPANEVVHA